MYVKVYANPGAKRESLETDKKGRLRISVTEPARANLANRRIVEVVAAHFGLPTGKVRIISGHQSPSKLVSVDTDEAPDGLGGKIRQ